MINLSLSVIICTYNPRRDYLQRVLDALQAQTLPNEQWELLVVDNASKEPLAGNWDLSGFPHARIVREDELGIAIARVRGIREAKGELLMFVDDDNVLASDYLEQTLKIGGVYDFLGAWGAAHLIPEFEVEPAESIRPWLNYLAIHSHEQSFWANISSDYAIQPAGAGCCLRRRVAEAYANNEAQARQLGRRGHVDLASCEDTDIVLTGCDLGLGYGVFVELRLKHLIPKRRLTEEYMLRLIEGSVKATALLKARREGILPPSPFKSVWRQKLGALRRRLMMKRMDRLYLEARMRGWEQAMDIIQQTSSIAARIRPQKTSEMSAIPWRR